MYISSQMFILIRALAIASVVIAGWRMQDSHRKLYRFIRENLHLHDELEGNTNGTHMTT